MEELYGRDVLSCICNHLRTGSGEGGARMVADRLPARSRLVLLAPRARGG
jgi:hypothetical protein